MVDKRVLLSDLLSQPFHPACFLVLLHVTQLLLTLGDWTIKSYYQDRFLCCFIPFISLTAPHLPEESPSLYCCYVNISVLARNALLLHFSKSFPHTTLGVTPCSSLGPHKLWWGGGFSYDVKSPFLMFCQTHSLENHCPVTEWRY